MKVLITSDIHGDLDKLIRLREIETFDLHLDAGDSNLHVDNLKRMQIISVKGNTDFFSQLPPIRVVENYLGKIIIVHGHTQNVKYGENNLLVLRNLTNKKNRKARFRCALTYVNADGKTITFEGIIEGKIAEEIKGDEGFGYDPIFLIESENKTLAELGADYKNRHSHRAKVLIKFKEYMEKNESINNE